MNKFTINPVDFTRVMTAAKLAVGARGALSMIHCKVVIGTEEDSLTATVTDSYRIHRITVPCTVMAGSDFSQPFLLPVMATKPSSKLPFVSVDIGDGFVTYTYGAVATKLGVVYHCYADMDKHLPTDEPIVTACVSPIYMRDAFAAFANEESVTIELRSKLAPVMIRAKAGSFALVCTIKEKE